MQNTKNQARGSGIHARHNPTNDKTVSDDLQNASGNIGAPPRYRLTKLGEQMARLPIDPKIARILLAAKKHDCMAEILVIASALSIQDPPERTLRTCIRRRVYPTVFRRRFQQPPRIHRPRNRPQQPGRRHPAHDSIETRRCGGIPIFRNARFAVYQ